MADAALVELQLAERDVVDGVKPYVPITHSLELIDTDQAAPDRTVCFAKLQLDGTMEVVMGTAAHVLGDDANRLAKGLQGLEGSVVLEINALAEKEPDRYVPYDVANLDAEAGQVFAATQASLVLPVRYAVNPQQPGSMLGLKLDDQALQNLMSQIHGLTRQALIETSRRLGTRATEEAAAQGFGSAAEYEAARSASEQAAQRVSTLRTELDQAEQQQARLTKAVAAGRQTLETAQAEHDAASARYRDFMTKVKAGNTSSHPQLLRYSNLRLEKADRGRVKIKGTATNTSNKPINRFVADVYMYRPDLGRTFVGVGEAFDFYWSGKRINPGESKQIEEWIVDFNALDRGGNTSEQAFRDVKPASIYMYHTKVVDTDKNNLIPLVKNSTDLRRLMERPDKALSDAKSSLSATEQQLAAITQELESLEVQLEEAETALESTQISQKK